MLSFIEPPCIKYILPAPKGEIIDRSQAFLDIPAEEGREFSSETPQNVTCQALRSFGHWSGGVQKTEHSIQSAYIDLIQKSEKFVYIENQFFVTTLKGNPSPQKEVANKLGQVIVDRIIRARDEGDTDYKIYIVIPLMPEFFGDIFKAETEAGTLKTVMHYQYASINKDDPETGITNGTIFTKLREEGIEPTDYIHFGALRAHQKITEQTAVTEVIYVHSKLLIVDDKYTIIGSANFNDRSQEGNRDSEFCLKFTDSDDSDFARSLRVRLFSRFINEDVTDLDPNGSELFNKWTSTAKKNSDILERVFKCAPNDVTKNFTELAEYGQTVNEQLIKSDPPTGLTELEGVNGVLVDYPLEFLKEEWFHPSTLGLSKERFAWFGFGTLGTSVYT